MAACTALLWLVSAALGVPELTSERASLGSVRSRVVADDADLVLFFGAEEEGELGTCGCSRRPLGSAARFLGYVRAARKASPDTPDVLLNAGAWLSSAVGDTYALRADANVRNAYVVEALEQGGWDALNVTFRDLPWLGVEGVPEASVSASVRPSDPDQLAPYRLLERGDLRVAVTGVSPSGMPYLQPEGWTWADPIEAVRELVPTLEEQADVVVVLAYDVERSIPALGAIEGVDVIIEASAFEGRFPPRMAGDAVWVRARHQTLRLGELRLWVEDGRVVRALDRRVDLDQRIPSLGPVRALARAADRDADRALQELYGGQ